MSSTNRVFVSPGVYTSEKDISYVTRQIGVTTLGLVGETTKGPAFQPIFVSNFNEFKSFFGGLDATIVKDTGAANLVSAVILDYRALDTLGEATVLFCTLIGTLTILRQIGKIRK